MTEAEQAQELFWPYQRAKGRYRQHQKKPVRKVRRFFRRTLNRKGKSSKGKGKRVTGKGMSSYLAELSQEDFDDMFFSKGKGKGSKGRSRGVKSSGKSMGRRTNPRGPDGQIMKCTGNNGRCGSETHFRRECPHEPQGKGSGGKGITSAAAHPSVHYVDTVDQFTWMIVATLPDGTQMSHGNVSSESVQVDHGNVTPASDASAASSTAQAEDDPWIPEPPAAHPSAVARWRGHSRPRIRGHRTRSCEEWNGHYCSSSASSNSPAESGDSNNSCDACEETMFMIQERSY